ncbi:YaaA family protein, partial [Burkholderia multivorans]|uniref:YaaA family protein n=1 Tax=Burkholderia multivorans TaxID=87883 RepID=UPI000DAD2B43
MKILLPPSEGKTPPAIGDPLDLAALSSPDLTPKRRQDLGALKKVSKRSDALAALGVGASLAEDVARNVTIDSQPCAPALLTYTGVLYEAMGAAELVAAAEADDSMAERLRDVHVFSAVFGQVSGLDPIPAYRLAMKTDLGQLGRLSTWWKPILTKSFSVGADEVVLDCRSSDYRAAWPGPNGQVVTLGAVKD